MPNLPVALQFFLSTRKVTFAAMIEEPNPATIWASLSAVHEVVLPDRSRRTILSGWADLIDVGVGEDSMLLSGVFIYANANGQLSDEPESWEVRLNDLARLTITIQNTPTGGTQQNLPIVAQDSTPQATGDPIVPTAINLFPPP